MKKNIHWLFKKLALWVQEGLINHAQAQAIRGRYPTEEQAGAWGRLAFGVSGAVLIGLGVILLFAYNWDMMHKFAKLSCWCSSRRRPGITISTLLICSGR